MLLSMIEINRKRSSPHIMRELDGPVPSRFTSRYWIAKSRAYERWQFWTLRESSAMTMSPWDELLAIKLPSSYPNRDRNTDFMTLAVRHWLNGTNPLMECPLHKLHNVCCSVKSSTPHWHPRTPDWKENGLLSFLLTESTYVWTSLLLISELLFVASIAFHSVSSFNASWRFCWQCAFVKSVPCRGYLLGQHLLQDWPRSWVSQFSLLKKAVNHVQHSFQPVVSSVVATNHENQQQI